MHIEECTHFSQNGVEWTSLQTTWGLDGVSMHGISNPCDNLSSIADSTDEMRQLHPHVLCPHPCDYGDPPRLV
uniref:Phospho-2-dehydro-3-deoxyheptonate aldolase 1 n=1 Tax=Arundo donax TaxID=35708 RepID=A0A0A9CNE0_ARUDO